MSASRCRRRQILKDTDRHPKLFLKLTTFHNNGARLKFPRSWTVRQKMKDLVNSHRTTIPLLVKHVGTCRSPETSKMRENINTYKAWDRHHSKLF